MSQFPVWNKQRKGTRKFEAYHVIIIFLIWLYVLFSLHTSTLQQAQFYQQIMRQSCTILLFGTAIPGGPQECRTAPSVIESLNTPSFTPTPIAGGDLTPEGQFKCKCDQESDSLWV